MQQAVTVVQQAVTAEFTTPAERHDLCDAYGKRTCSIYGDEPGPLIKVGDPGSNYTSWMDQKSKTQSPIPNPHKREAPLRRASGTFSACTRAAECPISARRASFELDKQDACGSRR